MDEFPWRQNLLGQQAGWRKAVSLENLPNSRSNETRQRADEKNYGENTTEGNATENVQSL